MTLDYDLCLETIYVVCKCRPRAPEQWFRAGRPPWGMDALLFLTLAGNGDSWWTAGPRLGPGRASSGQCELSTKGVKQIGNQKRGPGLVMQPPTPSPGSTAVRLAPPPPDRPPLHVQAWSTGSVSARLASGELQHLPSHTACLLLQMSCTGAQAYWSPNLGNSLALEMVGRLAVLFALASALMLFRGRGRTRRVIRIPAME